MAARIGRGPGVPFNREVSSRGLIFSVPGGLSCGRRRQTGIARRRPVGAMAAAKVLEPHVSWFRKHRPVLLKLTNLCPFLQVDRRRVQSPLPQRSDLSLFLAFASCRLIRPRRTRAGEWEIKRSATGAAANRRCRRCACGCRAGCPRDP